jgi:tetratricopeptide (TPR) repeat protein
MYQRLLPGDHPDVASTLKNLGWVRWDLGRPAEAERLFVQALEMRQRMYAGDHMYVAVSLHELGFLLNSQGRSSEALPKYEAALAMARRVGPAGNSSMLHAQIGLASTLVALGRFAEAEPLLIDSAEHCERSEDSRQRCWQGVLETSVKLYDAWHAAEPDKGYDAQAAEWRDKLAEWQATTQPAAAQSGASQPATAPP